MYYTQRASKLAQKRIEAERHRSLRYTYLK